MLYNSAMSRRIPIRDTVRLTGVGLCAATLLCWAIGSLIFPGPSFDSLERTSRPPVATDEIEIRDYFVPALSIVGLLYFLLVLEPIQQKHSSGHCRKCKYPLDGNKSGRCPECGTIIPTFRPTSAAYLACDNKREQRPLA